MPRKRKDAGDALKIEEQTQQENSEAPNPTQKKTAVPRSRKKETPEQPLSPTTADRKSRKKPAAKTEPQSKPDSASSSQTLGSDSASQCPSTSEPSKPAPSTPEASIPSEPSKPATRNKRGRPPAWDTSIVPSTDQVLIALETLLQRQESAQSKDQSAAVADTLSTMAELLRYAGECARAEAYYLRASEVRSRCFGKDSLTVARTMQQLAILKEGESCFSEAEKLYRWCVDTTIRKAGKEDNEITFLLTRLKHVLEAQNKPSTDADHIVAASANSAMNDPFDDFPWHYYCEQAREALAQGDLNHAEVLFNCLRDVAFAIGPDSVYLAQALEFLAGLALAKGRAQAALTLQRKALVKYAEVLGLGHPEVGRCVGRLADLYVSIGDLERARTAAQRAMDTLAAADGTAAEEVQIARHRLKKIVSAIATSQAANRTDTARRELEQITSRVEVERNRLKAPRAEPEAAKTNLGQPVASSAQQNSAISGGIVSAVSNNALGQISSRASIPDACRSDKSMEVSTAESSVLAARPDHTTQSQVTSAPSSEHITGDVLKESEDNVFDFLFDKYVAAGRRAMETKNYVEAERMFLVALEKARLFDSNDSRLWSTMCELADCHASTGKFYKASKIYQEVLEWSKKLHGPTSPTVVPYICRLGHNYSLQGELLKEHECYEEVLAILRAAGAPAYELAPHEERLLTLRRELEGS